MDYPCKKCNYTQCRQLAQSTSCKRWKAWFCAAWDQAVSVIRAATGLEPMAPAEESRGDEHGN